MAVDTVSFRAGPRAATAHRDAATAAGIFGVMVDHWIDSRFSRPSWSADNAHGVEDVETSDPTLAAQTIRLMWGLGEGPLPNIVQLCESKGVRVFGLPAVADSVDAFSAWSGGNPYIFLSRRKTPERSRFDIAHELGHIILHSSSTGTSNHDQREQDADRFAAEFLVPSTSIRQRLAHNPSVNQILTFRQAFRVSAMMAAKAALRGRRADEAGYRRLCSALARRGFRAGEPGGMAQHERSRIFTHIFGASAGDKQTSAAAIASDLGVGVDDVHALTFNTQVHGVPDDVQPTTPRSSPTEPSPPSLHLVKN
ncbi:MAG: ImmA/IrrE family metallo-endopeptidase [Mycobacteriaceae bacterium]